MQSCRGNQIKSGLIGLKIPILTPTKQCLDLQNLDQKSPGKQKIKQQPTLLEPSCSFSRFEKQQKKYNKIWETIQKERKLSKITTKQKQCMEKVCAVESINHINTIILDHRDANSGYKLTGNECQLETCSDFSCPFHLDANTPQNINKKEIRMNTEKIKKKPIITGLFQTQSIKISSFQHRQQQSNQNPQQYGTEKRLFSPKLNNYESSKKLFGSSNLPKRNDDQPKSASKILKSSKKLISSTEISKIHHHPLPHCHQSQRKLKVLPGDGIQLNRQIFKNYQRQRLYEHQQKDMWDFKQTSDSLSSIKSIPKFLRCRQEPYSKDVAKGKSYNTINHVLKIGQKIKLQVISNNNNTGAENPFVHFQVLRLISDSYSTTVYLVRQLKTNFIFCLKKCLANVSASQFQFLVKEGKYGAMIDHPYLLKTYCTLYDKQNIYQLLQYMEGSTLFQKSHIDRLKISPKRSKKSPQLSGQLDFHKKLESVKLILSSLLEATVYLHHNGFIHRDIKPSNVFISHDFTIKLGDFGSCGRIGTREYVGTLDYVSPEVLLRQPYDEKIDAWAIGCLAYELWVGVPPFYHQLRSTTIVNIVQKDFERQKLDHAELLDLIQLMLEKDPKKRISAEEAMEHPFLQQQSMSAPTSPMSPNVGSQLNYYRHYK